MEVLFLYSGPLLVHGENRGTIQTSRMIDVINLDTLPSKKVYEDLRKKVVMKYRDKVSGVDFASCSIGKEAKYWSTEPLTECGVPVRYCNCSCDERCQFVVTD